MTTSAARLAIPPIGNDDRIPHDVAVWRTQTGPNGTRPCKAPPQTPICVEYAGGIIARTYAGSVPDWSTVVRWRFGWPPA
jgi:hypothetical protein